MPPLETAAGAVLLLPSADAVNRLRVLVRVLRTVSHKHKHEKHNTTAYRTQRSSTAVGTFLPTERATDEYLRA